MALIKIVNGTYGYKAPGSKRIEPKNSGSPPFEIDDVKAEYLVEHGIACYVLDIDEEEISEDDNDIEEDGTPVYSVDMKVNQLREIMEANGLSYRVGMTKEDIVNVLDGFYGKECDDSEDNEEDDDGEKPPSHSAAEPVI